MPFVIVRVSLQTAVPAGTITVSPSAAEATEVFTSVRERLVALIIAASASPKAAKNSAARAKDDDKPLRFFLGIGEFPVLF
jgi:hypothetical protein